MVLSHHYSPSCVGFEALASHNPKTPLFTSPSTPFRSRSPKNQLVISFTHNSKHSEIEEGKREIIAGPNKSKEAWEQILELVKEQTAKMQGMSKEAYEVYSKKATIILVETSKKLKLQAEKASQDLTTIAKEISKEFLSKVAKNSPEGMMSIVENLASSNDGLKEVSKIHDFCLGIPYGAVLSVSGFLSFMFTGSIPAIRFGVILGGVLLYLSLSSLRSWKRRESSDLALKGQTAIATSVFLRELRLVSQRQTPSGYLAALVSGAMVMFYLYRIILDGNRGKGPSLGNGSES